MDKAVVLFSGGLDSTAALYWTLKRCQKVYALTFDYGQRHRVEIALARKLCRKLKIPQAIIKFDFNQLGHSSLTDREAKLPALNMAGKQARPPSTYVPFRNGIFLSLAAAWAESHQVYNLVCGFHILDSPSYPDTTARFVKAVEKVINAGTSAAFSQNKYRIRAPFINLTKAQIIKAGLALGADYSFSYSCYSGQDIPCFRCASCRIRAQAWKELGMKDPYITRLKKGGRI